jgi:hypothetical protein
MKRHDLTILNATRIIITRAKQWSPSSRLYSIEIRWDYDKSFAKYVWNNERYSLPSPVANKVAHIDTKIVAQTCSKLGLMFKSRFEHDITNDVYMEVWRKDLRDNKEEQRKLTLQEALKNYVAPTEQFDIEDADEVVCDMFDDDVEAEADVMSVSLDIKVEEEFVVTVKKKDINPNYINVDNEEEVICDLFD